MSLNLSSFDAALKEHYTNDYVENLVYKNNPALALMPKMEEFGGRNLRIPLIYGNPQGRSATFSQAQARGQITNSKIEDFVLTRVHDYSIATVDNETLLASKGDENAFMQALTTEVDGAINSLTRSIAVAMYGTGFGDIGQILVGSSVAGLTITMNRVSDITNFEVGMELVAAAAATTGATRALGTSGNGLLITGINRSSGVLTFAFNVNDATNGIPTLAASDFLFVRGDRDTSVTPAATKVSGFEAWIPTTAALTNTPFFSVDRTIDATRLAGLSLDATNLPIEEALIEGSNLVGNEGGMIDTYFMNFRTYSALTKALGSKVQYIDLKANAEIAFRGIQIVGTKGTINVVPDQNCPSNRIRGVHLDMWKLYSLGKAVRVVESDDLQILRQTSADGVELRYASYLNMGCRAPRDNINIQV